MSILAAVDGEEGSEHVVEIAHDLAEKYNHQLVVLHVMPEDEYERQQDASPELTLDRAKGSARDGAERVVVDALGATEGVTVRGEVGDVEATVLGVADALDVQYLVIGSRRKSPVGKALFGSTTQALLLDAESPVVAVPVDKAQ